MSVEDSVGKLLYFGSDSTVDLNIQNPAKFVDIVWINLERCQTGQM